MRPYINNIIFIISIVYTPKNDNSFFKSLFRTWIKNFYFLGILEYIAIIYYIIVNELVIERSWFDSRFEQIKNIIVNRKRIAKI